MSLCVMYFTIVKSYCHGMQSGNNKYDDSDSDSDDYYYHISQELSHIDFACVSSEP